MSELTGSLRFSVKGSNPKPYEIVATGSGSTLRITCGCPAGSRSGAFCKHVASLLLGDITNVVDGADSVSALRGRAEGTGWITRAIGHNPSKKSPRLDNLNSIEEVFDASQRRLGERCRIEMRDDGFPTIALLKPSPKTGKFLRKPFVALEYREFTYDYEVTEDGRYVPYQSRPNSKPWCVQINGERPRSFADLGAAAYAFFEEAEKALG